MMRKTLRARVDEEDDEREDAKEDEDEEEEEDDDEEENEDEEQRASSFTSSYFKATNVNVNRILQACKPDNKKAPMRGRRVALITTNSATVPKKSGGMDVGKRRAPNAPLGWKKGKNTSKWIEL